MRANRAWRDNRRRPRDVITTGDARVDRPTARPLRCRANTSHRGGHRIAGKGAIDYNRLGRRREEEGRRTTARVWPWASKTLETRSFIDPCGSTDRASRGLAVTPKVRNESGWCRRKRAVAAPAGRRGRASGRLGVRESEKAEEKERLAPPFRPLAYLFRKIAKLDMRVPMGLSSPAARRAPR